MRREIGESRGWSGRNISRGEEWRAWGERWVRGSVHVMLGSKSVCLRGCNLTVLEKVRGMLTDQRSFLGVLRTGKSRCSRSLMPTVSH